jgi:A/G-specific adenine glycosylase
VSRRLLDWYDGHRRDLPWRYAPGTAADPYRVWLSEIMLQQTTVKAVIPYFDAFTRRWPTVAALAAAPREDVLAAWAGLGYYSRARNLHACAQAVVDRHAGHFPADEAMLLALPGIGPYTAAAIAAIGHGLKATPVDGNIERVTARLFAIETPLPAAKAELKRHAAMLTPETRAGDFAQAMMDLGATVCTPKNPTCLVCPLQEVCAAQRAGLSSTLPRKAPKPDKPTRYGAAFVTVRPDGAVLTRRRPDKGLLGGMLEVPGTAWGEAPPGPEAVRAAAPIDAAFEVAPERVVHVFTHFRLILDVHAARVPKLHVAPDGDWLARDALGAAALPTVMRRVVQVGLEWLEQAPSKGKPRPRRPGSTTRAVRQ